MATWKKVLVEDADITVGSITATLGAATADLGDDQLTANLVVSATDGATEGALTVAEVTFGTAAFDSASSFATAAQGTTADSAVQPGEFLKDLVAGTGLSGGADNILYGSNSDVTVNLDITTLSASSGTVTVVGADLVALYDVSPLR